VRIFTRRGLDWTSQYRDLAKAAGELGVESAIIDGEIIVLNEAGLSDFGELRKAITRRQHDLYFVAFDLLHLNSHDLRDMPLEDRCEILAETHPIQRSSAGHRRRGLSPCRSSRAWGRGVETQGQPVSKRDFDKLAEAKCHAIGEFDLLGVEREPGKPAFALLAERGTGRYVGSAFITLNREMRERLWKRVQEHAGPAPKGMKRPATKWVKPGLIGRVKHLRGEEDLRHASLQDFREET